MERKSFHLSKTALGAFVLLCAASFTYYWIALRPLPFDSNQWKRARAAQEYNVCYRMSTSLVQKLSTERMSGEQLIELLGKPDSHPTPIDWRYKLKAHPNTFFPDDYWLSVFIDNKDSRVTKAWVHPG
jgi:hypothetical protein